jgi:hypothetical protein
MDAQTAREESAWPLDLPSDDLPDRRYDADCLVNNRPGGSSETAPTVACAFNRLLGVTGESLRSDENQRLSKMILDMTGGLTETDPGET